MDFRGKVAATVIIVILGVTSTLSQDYAQICQEMGCDRGQGNDDKVCVIDDGDANNPGIGRGCAKICALFLRVCDPSCDDDHTCVSFSGICRNGKARCAPNQSIH